MFSHVMGSFALCALGFNVWHIVIWGYCGEPQLQRA